MLGDRQILPSRFTALNQDPDCHLLPRFEHRTAAYDVTSSNKELEAEPYTFKAEPRSPRPELINHQTQPNLLSVKTLAKSDGHVGRRPKRIKLGNRSPESGLKVDFAHFPIPQTFGELSPSPPPLPLAVTPSAPYLAGTRRAKAPTKRKRAADSSVEREQGNHSSPKLAPKPFHSSLPIPKTYGRLSPSPPMLPHSQAQQVPQVTLLSLPSSSAPKTPDSSIEYQGPAERSPTHSTNTSSPRSASIQQAIYQRSCDSPQRTFYRVADAFAFGVQSQNQSVSHDTIEQAPLFELYGRLERSHRLSGHARDTQTMLIGDLWRNEAGHARVHVIWQGWKGRPWAEKEATEMLYAGTGAQSMTVRVLGRLQEGFSRQLEGLSPVIQALDVRRVSEGDIERVRHVAR